MKVQEAIERLMDLPLEADLMVCAHEFPGLAGQGWHVQSFDPTDDGMVVLIEGAVPPQPEPLPDQSLEEFNEQR